MRPQALKGLLIATLLACVAGSAGAQGVAPMAPAAKTPQQIEQEKQLERRYQESLKKIPDGKANSDPWGNVRGADAEPAPVKPVRPKPAPKSASKPAPTGTAAATPKPAASVQ
jgi:hypothetical protein